MKNLTHENRKTLELEENEIEACSRFYGISYKKYDMNKNDLEVLRNSMNTPFVIEKDVDYYTDLQSKLLEFKKLLIAVGVEDKIILIAEKFRTNLMSILREYYKGNIAYSQTKMINQIRAICKEDNGTAKRINDCWIFDGYTENIPFSEQDLMLTRMALELRIWGLYLFL